MPEPELQELQEAEDGEEVSVKPRNLDPIEGHFILMDGWEEGLRHRSESVKLGTFEAGTMYEHSWRPPPVRNALTDWLVEIGLGHKEGMIQERLYLNLWRVGLPVEMGGVSLDLEALVSERGLGYVHRRARGLDLNAVDRFLELLDFTAEEQATFRAELMQLGVREEPTLGVSFSSPSSPKKQSARNRRKNTKKKSSGAQPLQRLGEDPEMRRKAAERIQAAQRGKWGRRKAQHAKKTGQRATKKTGRREYSTFRGMAPMRQDAAAARIQAAHRGKRGRRAARAQTRKAKNMQKVTGGLTREDAAVRIQSVQRGKRARRGAGDAHAARVRAARNEKEWLLDLDRHSAATRIQAVHRGKRGRRKAKRKKRSVTVAMEPVQPELQPEPQREPVDVAAFNAALRRYDEEYEEGARKREGEAMAAQLAASQKAAAELGKMFEGLLEQERDMVAKTERDAKARAARDKALMLAKWNNREPLDVSKFNCARRSYLGGLESALSELNELADELASLTPLPPGEEAAPWRRAPPELAWQMKAS